MFALIKTLTLIKHLFEIIAYYNFLLNYFSLNYGIGFVKLKLRIKYINIHFRLANFITRKI